MHIRAAITNGLSRDEIKEILLQTAIYCGVPSANTAFKTAQQVFQQMDNAATDNAGPDQPATPPN
jgi:4-carboxymuconolactone decarboxylase